MRKAHAPLYDLELLTTGTSRSRRIERNQQADCQGALKSEHQQDVNDTQRIDRELASYAITSLVTLFTA